MSSMVEAIEQAIKVEDAKPRKKRSPTQKAENERRKFCNVTRKMLDQVTSKNRMLDGLISQERERQILTGVKGQSDFNKHRQVLETLKMALLGAKVAFNCGD